MTPRRTTFTEDDLREMVLRLAHEIRNPLATIKSAVQLLEHLQRPEGETAEFYESIHTEVARIDRVVRDMQLYVRLDTCHPTRVAIAEVVRSAVEAEEGGATSAAIELRIAEGPSAEVLVDPFQLQTALRELINNAVRFSSAGAPVIVSWRADGNARIAVEVSDNGRGIADEVTERVMRPFFSTSTHGTGLGLNIVARIAELVDGDLSWAAIEGGGTRFTLNLPRL